LESIEITPVNPDVSRPEASLLTRVRNRLDVGFASRTEAVAGIVL
jgi:hypothetical protein